MFSWQQGLRGAFRENWRVTLGKASELLNTATGYHLVEARKRSVLEKEGLIDKARLQAYTAKIKYEEAIEERRRCQKDINSLMQRKDSWSTADVSLFTELYRKEIALEQQELGFKQEQAKYFEHLEKAQADYLAEIRERYMEEQLYSDKIRSASTWWTWGLITTHFLIFITVQFVTEPRKREKLKQELLEAMQAQAEVDKQQFNQLYQTLLAQQQALQGPVMEMSNKINKSTLLWF